MKNKLLFLILLSIFLVSCKSPLDNLSKKDDSALATVTFDIGLENSQNSRKIVPTYTTEDGKPFYTAFTYELIATDKNDPENNLTLSNKKYDELTSLEAELYIGHIYNFELNAYNKEKTKVLSGTQNEVTIAKTDNKISFLLNSVSTINGKFEIKFLNFYIDNECETLLVNLYKLSDFLQNNSNAKNLAKIENGIIDTENRTFTYSDSLSPGEYYFSVAISKDGIVNTCFSDQITIVSSLTTEKTLFFECEYPTTNLYLNGGTFDFESEEFKSAFETTLPFIPFESGYHYYDNLNFILDNNFFPQKQGYLFTGWYFDPEYTKPFYNTTQTYDLKENINLYARWYKTNITLDTPLLLCNSNNAYYTKNYLNPEPDTSILYTDYSPNCLFAMSPDNNILYYAKYTSGNSHLYKANEDTSIASLGGFNLASLVCPSNEFLYAISEFGEDGGGKYLYIFKLVVNAETLSQIQISGFTTYETSKYVRLAVVESENAFYITYKLNKKNYIAKYTYNDDFTEATNIFTKEITLPKNELAEITDFVYDKDSNKFYLTTKYGAIEWDEDNSYYPYAYIFGNIYEVSISGSDVSLNPLIKEFTADTPTCIRTNNVGKETKIYASNDKYSFEQLFGPARILAITPKKLILTDSGAFVYEKEPNKYGANSVNRIVEIDLDTKLIDYVYDVGAFELFDSISGLSSCFQ